MTAAAAMVSTWASAVWDPTTTSAARIAIVAPARSVQNWRAMPHTACATTATATTLRPCTQPASLTSQRSTP